MSQDRVVLIQEEPRGPSQLVEIPVTRSGVTKVQFPDIQQLRSDQTQQIVIKMMRLVTGDFLTNGMITAGVNAPVTELQKISVVLYCEGWEKGQLIPILTMNDGTFAGSTFPHVYRPMYFNNWKNVDWSKSYVQFANGTASVADTPYVLMFDVLYTRFKLAMVTNGGVPVLGNNGQALMEYQEIVGPN